MNRNASSPSFERGAVVLSIDTEQIWGYLGTLTEAQFNRRYPESREAHIKLLKLFAELNIRATWLVVGGLALGGSHDLPERIAGLPGKWTSQLQPGSKSTAPLWYSRAFVTLLRDAFPAQEIGLHGGLTHLIWTNSIATRDVVETELLEGLSVLRELNIEPRSFSFARDQEAHHRLLAQNGITVYRGRTPVLAYRLGRTLPGALLRVFDEISGSAPPPVWPTESLPGLWNLPSSLFLYPMTPWRTNIIGLRSRIKRFEQGIEAAVRSRGVFHFCFHPENLAESNHGFLVFEEILELLTRARDQGDIEVLTMGDIGTLIERHTNADHRSPERPAALVSGGAKQPRDQEIIGLA
jgi:hypothetical protein